MTSGGWRGPGWRIFDADPANARKARQLVSSAITGHDCPVDAEEAALAVGELFANAVIHGPAGGRVLAGYCRISSARSTGSSRSPTTTACGFQRCCTRTGPARSSP